MSQPSGEYLKYRINKTLNRNFLLTFDTTYNRACDSELGLRRRMAFLKVIEKNVITHLKKHHYNE